MGGQRVGGVDAHAGRGDVVTRTRGDSHQNMSFGLISVRSSVENLEGVPGVCTVVLLPLRTRVPSASHKSSNTELLMVVVNWSRGRSFASSPNGFSISAATSSSPKMK